MTDIDNEVDFGIPFRIDAEGRVQKADDAPYVEYTVYDYGLGLGGIEWPSGWTPVTGFSGQYGYSGPVMHPSEVLGGDSPFERHVRSNPGMYVLVLVGDFPDVDAPDPEPYGWALLRKD